jgi:tetratricopeptide (TPR) repeat protein
MKNTLPLSEDIDQLVRSPTTRRYRQDRLQETIAVKEAAVDAAERVGNAVAEARGRRYLGSAYAELRRFDLAREQFLAALDLAARGGDRAMQGHTHLRLSRLCELESRHSEALDHASRALGVFQANGNVLGEAGALNAVGWYHALLGHHEQAKPDASRRLPCSTGLAHTPDEPTPGTVWAMPTTISVSTSRPSPATPC